MKKESWNLCLETLSPVHIGCDTVYSPIEFRTDHATNELVVFQTEKWVSCVGNDGRRRLSEAAKRGTLESLLAIMKMIDASDVDGRRIPAVRGVLENHARVMGLAGDEKRLKNEFNAFEIRRTAYRLSDHRPYIPGSTMKGAMRTAWLNAVRKKKSRGPGGGSNGYRLQQELLDYRFVDGDPFRLVKVSDFHPVGDAGVEVLYAINTKRHGDATGRGVPQILEVIKPGQRFWGTVTIDQPSHRKTPIHSPIDGGALKLAIADFFDNRQAAENRILATLNKDRVETGEEIPLCVGYHSGAENMTVEGHRKIWIMGGKGKKGREADEGTTIWLTSQYNSGPGSRPLGWCGLAICDERRWKELEVLEDTFQDETLEKKEAMRRTEVERKARQEEERKQAEERERIRAEEERARLAREAVRAAMSPLERCFEDLKDSETIAEQRIAAIVREDLLTAEDGEARLLAIALKHCLEARGEWKVKKKSKARYERKQIILRFLDE
ncbi:type III-A CRISPR-associated RAMP protein Csm5 [Desulfoluna butyratoxydans]|uniref:CRISPR system Cms protein Csm5 n=1 Tax=Desulfoluna butyratoxydans TaxID=231438 RepID=A0A4V6IL07_9BACT|nr:type III-A CRISPR-associated RAMP protein Csm5 [Desulfoluna butyratoxydans]VFQ43168.1 crispr-associated protein tm1807 [Desulfoluna butyratoxydans]